MRPDARRTVAFQPREDDLVIAEPVMFIADAAASNTVVWKGARLEVFTTKESPSTITPGQRVRALYVPETGQVFVLEVIA